MATVYSKRFIAASGITAEVSETVPAGVIWILRDVDIYCNAPLGGSRFFLEGSIHQTLWSAVTNPNSINAVGWRGRQVLVSGESFYVRADTPTDVTISGYELSLP